MAVAVVQANGVIVVLGTSREAGRLPTIFAWVAILARISAMASHVSVSKWWVMAYMHESTHQDVLGLGMRKAPADA